MHSPTYCHNLVACDLADWNNPNNIKLYHYVDNLSTVYGCLAWFRDEWDGGPTDPHPGKREKSKEMALRAKNSGNNLRRNKLIY